MEQYMGHIQTSTRVYDTVRKEERILYNIDFGLPMKVIVLINMCLKEKFMKVCIGDLFMIISITNMI
jgi:hypothetical protein